MFRTYQEKMKNKLVRVKNTGEKKEELVFISVTKLSLTQYH